MIPAHQPASQPIDIPDAVPTRCAANCSYCIASAARVALPPSDLGPFFHGCADLRTALA
jgi:hypothetical protein